MKVQARSIETPALAAAKIKAHLWTLPRWFAAPLVAAPVLLGALLAGGVTVNSWIGVLAALLIFAGALSFNSFLDYAWTGLDKGEPGERSAEKDYTGAQSLIARGIVGPGEVAVNALAWYALALVPVIYLAVNVGWPVLAVALAAMLMTFWYSKAKFNWTHELALAVGTAPLPVLLGMFATTSSPPLTTGLVACVPFAVIHSFAGLALDEWPDAEANLKKGVKSIAYKVWENGVSLEWYLSTWFLFMYLYHIFLISIGVLAPLSAIAFASFPVLMGCMVFLKNNFRKVAGITVLVALSYPVLLVLGQALGD
jgi:1,4-dihydroxy-2-naphthoate octaprenyltransferase